MVEPSYATGRPGRGRPEGRHRRRLEPHQHAVGFGGQHVEESIRPLPDVANALLQLAQHRLAVELFPLVVEVNPLEVSGAGHFALPHTAGEQIVLPVGEASPV